MKKWSNFIICLFSPWVISRSFCYKSSYKLLVRNVYSKDYENTRGRFCLASSLYIKIWSGAHFTRTLSFIYLNTVYVRYFEYKFPPFLTGIYNMCIYNKKWYKCCLQCLANQGPHIVINIQTTWDSPLYKNGCTIVNLQSCPSNERKQLLNTYTELLNARCSPPVSLFNCAIAWNEIKVTINKGK